MGLTIRDEVGPNFDILRGTFHLSRGNIDLSLRTEYDAAGQETISITINPPTPALVHDDILPIINQILPGYPLWPARESESRYRLYCTLFNVPASPQRVLARKFILATRIIKVYNSLFANALKNRIMAQIENLTSKGSDSTAAQASASATTSAVPRLPLGTFLVVAEGSLQLYLRSVPENPYTEKLKLASIRINTMIEMNNRELPITKYLIDLKDFIDPA